MVDVEGLAQECVGHIAMCQLNRLCANGTAIYLAPGGVCAGVSVMIG